MAHNHRHSTQDAHHDAVNRSLAYPSSGPAVQVYTSEQRGDHSLFRPLTNLIENNGICSFHYESSCHPFSSLIQFNRPSGRYFRFSYIGKARSPEIKTIKHRDQQGYIIDIFGSLCQKTLYLHFLQPAKTGITVSVMLLRIRKTTLYRLLSSLVNFFTPLRYPVFSGLLFTGLPDMAGYRFSAFRVSAGIALLATLADSRRGLIMPVSLTVGCGINQFFALRVDITILRLVIDKMFLLKGVQPAITHDGDNA